MVSKILFITSLVSARPWSAVFLNVYTISVSKIKFSSEHII